MCDAKYQKLAEKIAAQELADVFLSVGAKQYSACGCAPRSPETDDARRQRQRQVVESYRGYLGPGLPEQQAPATELETVVLAEPPQAVTDALAALTRFAEGGHTPGCACQLCGAARQVLIEHECLDLASRSDR